MGVYIPYLHVCPHGTGVGRHLLEASLFLTAMRGLATMHPLHLPVYLPLADAVCILQTTDGPETCFVPPPGSPLTWIPTYSDHHPPRRPGPSAHNHAAVPESDSPRTAAL
jgi:hypothetical protein